MRLLVCGSRGWHDEVAIEAVLRYYQQRSRDLNDPFVLIHGHCPQGADAIADRVGRRLGLRVGEDLIRVPANWDLHKRAAGPIRNQQMLDEHHPDEVVAFRSTGKSNGTDDMVSKAERAGVETHVIRTHADTHALTRHA